MWVSRLPNRGIKNIEKERDLEVARPKHKTKSSRSYKKNFWTISVLDKYSSDDLKSSEE
jgi:hypothetical protein